MLLTEDLETPGIAGEVNAEVIEVEETIVFKKSHLKPARIEVIKNLMIEKVVNLSKKKDQGGEEGFEVGEEVEEDIDTEDDRSEVKDQVTNTPPKTKDAKKSVVRVK